MYSLVERLSSQLQIKARLLDFVRPALSEQEQNPDITQVFSDENCLIDETMTTSPATDRSCLICKRLDAAYQKAVSGIQAAARLRGTVPQKVAELYRQADERDRVLVELYRIKRRFILAGPHGMVGVVR